LKRQILISGLLFFITYNLLAQFDTENQLINSIKSIKTDYELNQFLLHNEFIPNEKDTTTHFRVNSIKTNIFHKNLFGDSANETIIQIHDERAYTINVFYCNSGKLKKVHGQLAIYFEEGSGYFDQSFLLHFENIFNENEFCIITKNHGGYNRTVSENISINKIRIDTILQLYNFESNYSSYSGVLTYDYRNETNYKFQLLNNTYPKALIITTKFNNEEAKARNEDGYLLSGIKSYGGRIETILFSDNGVKTHKTVENKKEDIFINFFDDIANIQKRNGCDTNITLYIADRFFYTYLLDTSQMPLKKTEFGNNISIHYLKCCHAYIIDRTLFAVLKDSVTGKNTTTKYILKPSVSEILKQGINPKHLYYFELNNSNYRNSFSDTLVYFNTDTIFSEEERNAINLGDQALVYQTYWYYDKEIDINIYDSLGTWLVVSLNKIAPFLKPDILELFKKTKKSK